MEERLRYDDHIQALPPPQLFLHDAFKETFRENSFSWDRSCLLLFCHLSLLSHLEHPQTQVS